MAQMVDPISGQMTEVDDAEAAKLQRKGWAAPTPEQLRAADLQRRHGGVAGQLVAAGTGYLRGLPVIGAGSDAALIAVSEALGDDGARRALNELREANPNASAIGEFGGMITPIPGLQALRGGSLLAQAGEGALFGGQSEISESVLADRELTAEALVSSMGFGAAIGGGIGGVIAGGSRLLKAGGSRLASALRSPGAEGATALAKRAFGESADGVGDAVGRAWQEGAQVLGVEGAENLGRMGALTREGAALRREAVNASKTVREGAEEIADAIKRAHREMVDSGEQFKGALKESAIRKAMGDNAEAAIMRSQAEATAIRTELANAHAAGKGRFGFRDKISNAKAAADAALERLAKETDPTKAMMVVDALKRDVGRLAPRGGGTSAQQATRELMVGHTGKGGIYERLRTVLEDETLWGGAGKLQRELNEPWAEVFDALKQDDALKHIITQKPRGAFNAMVDEIDEKALSKLLSNPSDPFAQKTLGMMREWLGKGDNFVSSAAKNLDGVDNAAAGRFSEAMKQAGTAIDRVSKADELGKQLNAMSGGELGTAIAAAAAAIGYNVGGADTAAGLGLLASVVADPRRGIRQLAALESLAGRTLGRIPSVGAKLKRLAGVGQTAALQTALTARERDKREKAATELRNVDLSQVERDVRARLVAASTGAPETVELAVKHTLRGVAYLKEHAPGPRVRPGLVGAQLKPSDHELEVFERRRRIVADPMSIIGSVEGGTITREAVHALDATAPLIAARLRDNYREMVQELSDEGKALPQQTALALEMLLGHAVEGINHPDSVMAIRSVLSAPPPPPEQKQPGQRKPALADHLRDPLFGPDEE